MTLIINLPDDLAVELSDEAKRRGVDSEQYAAQIIRENLPASERAKAARALFAQWEAEDQTDDPAELARRVEDWKQFKHMMNANRGSGRKLFAE